MTKITIKNWDKWQSYRRDRGQPPWIKVHRCLMRNLEWVQLTDAQRGQLVAIWLLAADHDGVIMASSAVIRKLCFMSEDPDLQLFESLGFIEIDDKETSERRQDDANMTCQSREETEKRQRRKILHSQNSNPKNDRVPYSEIISLYHEILSPPLPRVAKLTETRKSYIRQRWLQDMNALKNWENFFRHVAQSDFLMGKAEAKNGTPPFRADIEWLCRPSNFTKIAEGKYHRV